MPENCAAQMHVLSGKDKKSIKRQVVDIASY